MRTIALIAMALLIAGASFAADATITLTVDQYVAISATDYDATIAGNETGNFDVTFTASANCPWQIATAEFTTALDWLTVNTTPTPSGNATNGEFLVYNMAWDTTDLVGPVAGNYTAVYSVTVSAQ